MRQDSVPWAYRVFSRQVGIDPDSDRTPVEAIALERLRHGGLKSENLLDDALTVAIAETGVPIVALDTERVEGSSACGCRYPGRRSASCAAVALPDRDRRRSAAGRDRARRAGALFGGHARVPSATLCALQVKGVPRISVEEALWTAAEWLYTGRSG